MIRVLVIADSPFAQAGLEGLLAAQPGLEIVSRDPDVVVQAKDWDGGEHETASPAPVVLLSRQRGVADLAAALRSGVRAVLPADAPPHEIAAAAEAAASGLVVLTPEDAESLLPAVSASMAALPEALTAREREVLRMLAEGLSNKEIAGRLRISDHTAKFHVASILSKLNAATRTEAVMFGIRRGLVPV